MTLRLPRVLQSPPPPVGALCFIAGTASSGDWSSCAVYLEGQGYQVLPTTGELRENVQQVLLAHFVVVLPGWEFTLAGNAEVALARALKLPILACRTLTPVVLA